MTLQEIQYYCLENNKAEFNLDIILTKEVILPERKCCNDDFARNRILLFKK